MQHFSRRPLSAAVAAILAGVSGQVVAQVLDEFIVTAERRETALQQTPISVAAFSAETMELKGLETLEDILASSTKVLVDTDGGNNLLYLPLDQLMRRSSGAAGDRAVTSSVPLSSNVETRDLRERGSR